MIGSRPYLTQSKGANLCEFAAVSGASFLLIARENSQISPGHHGQRSARGIRTLRLKICPCGPESQAAQPNLPIAGKPLHNRPA